MRLLWMRALCAKGFARVECGRCRKWAGASSRGSAPLVLLARASSSEVLAGGAANRDQVLGQHGERTAVLIAHGEFTDVDVRKR